MSGQEGLIDSHRRRDARRSADASQAAFSVMADARYGTRLGFRFAGGAMRSLPYTHLIETQYEPDLGIILTYSAYRVTLTGRNLGVLYLRIEEEFACEIFERHHYHDVAPSDPREKAEWDSAPYIEKIKWENL